MYKCLLDAGTWPTIAQSVPAFLYVTPFGNPRSERHKFIAHLHPPDTLQQVGWDEGLGHLSLVTYATLEPSRGAAKPTIDGPTIDGHVDDTDRVHKPVQNQLQPPLQLERHTKPPTWRDHDYDGDRDHDTV